MGMTWTESQKKVIDRRERNILVSAAAGSGKTAVLVERIIQKITQDKVDIDKLLIVTFTNAAAAEMRERIRDAIEKSWKKNRRILIYSASLRWYTMRRSQRLTVFACM